MSPSTQQKKTTPWTKERKGTSSGRKSKKRNPLATSGDDKPQVILSVLGERLKDCWKDIPAHYPEVSVIKLCVMPDHIHGVLFVKEKMPHHLGTIINGFKAGTRKAARELGVITATMSPSTEPAPVRYTEASPQSKSPQGVLWEPGYNDRILLQEGQLQRMLKQASKWKLWAILTYLKTPLSFKYNAHAISTPTK